MRAIVAAGGPVDGGTKAEAVKWHDDKVGSMGGNTAYVKGERSTAMCSQGERHEHMVSKANMQLDLAAMLRKRARR